MKQAMFKFGKGKLSFKNMDTIRCTFRITVFNTFTVRKFIRIACTRRFHLIVK